ncbi:MAG TPA: hypothetical protein GX702_02150 [Chloroflexi bacterium]|nr:hypothetical protein [Chloroflexota bacterium]
MGINNYWGYDDNDPIPTHEGLKPKNAEITRSWWARQWLRALTQWMSPTWLAHGRAYARQGQVLDLEVQVGLVLARVQGTRPQPYRVRIEISTFTEEEWTRVIDSMAAQAIYAAQLLNGEMPHDIDDVFSAVGVSLFPNVRSVLTTQCNCPKKTNPCKHVAAVNFILGERMDEDPFILFLLRGRSKEQIMASLRARRAEHHPFGASYVAAPVVESRGDMPLDECIESFWEMGPELEDLQIRVRPPDVEREIIKLLGDPSFIEDDALHKQLQALYGVVSQQALDIAFEQSDAADDEDVTPDSSLED